MRSLSAGLETARTQTYARALLGLVVAVAAFGAGNFVHAQPGQESSPKSTARAADGGYRVVEFSRLLPRAPLPAGVESEPAAAPQILAVSFSAVAGPVRWYPPRRLIDVTVKFDRAVTVNTAGGTPRIDLVLGTRLLRHAGYASGSGSPDLTFQYVTGDWNQALSDIAVGASSLRLNGGRIDSLADAIAADLAHAAGRLDNVGARPDFAADNSFLVAASGTGAGANYVALPPAVLRTPLPSLNPDDGLVQSRSGHGLVGGQWTVPPVSGDPGAALASVTVRARLRGLEPLLELSLFQQAISGSPWTAPATAAIAFAPGESRRDTESALADVRQYRVTPAQDDETTATSNTLRAAGTGVPEAPYLWAWVEGQTQVRLQWSRGSSANPPVEDHKIEVCAEADVLDCDDDDNDDEDWTVEVERHPQAPSTRSNSYTHGGLVAGSTRHYRVSSRNDLGHSAASVIKSATTQSMRTSADCTGATWEADMTVAEWGLHDDKGYRAHGEAGGGDDEGLLTNYSFTLGRVTYEINQLWYSPSVFSPTQRRGWIYFPPSYHLALSKFPDEGKLEDLTLYIGGIKLPLSGAGYSTQTFGESFRWSTAQISDLERDERPTSMYEGTFNYRVGDTVEVCLTDSAPTVSLILTPSSISEDGGASTVTAIVEQGSESPFEVTVLVAADSPAAPADFTLSENMVLSFAANEMQSTGIVTITGEDNDVHAPHKRLTVSGELSVGARPTPPGSVKLTIENDDVAPVLSVTVSEAAIIEAGGVSEVVVSTGDTTYAAEQTITLTFTGSAEKGTDYRVSTEELTLPASEHSVTATVTAEQDTVDEDDETILVSATHGGVDVGTQQQITITDDDDEPELSITSDTVEEGKSAEFEVTLNPASGRDVMVSYITEDVTATAGDDYTALPSTTLTFTAGETAKTLTVTTENDTLHEQTETFSVTLSAATNAALEDGGSTLSGTGTIDDNDRLPKVSIADATAVIEGASAEFEVSLDVTSGSEVTVTYATGDADDTAQPPGDYTAVASTTLTFAAGDQVKTITIATQDDDLDEEHGETFTVTLSAPGNAELAADGTTATGTITDDDDPPNLSIGNATAVVEGQAAEFEVSLDQPSGKEVTVTYATGDTDDTAQAPGDYQAVANTTLTFAAGDQVKTITVATEDDDLDEEDGETFTVTLSAPGNAELAADGTTATGTINDADDEPQLSIGNATAVVEGQAAEFVVSLNAASGQQVTVSYATADGTAKAGEDYSAETNGTLTFVVGATKRTIGITTAEDSRNEAQEEFTVTLSNRENATLATDGTTATGTITDDDTEPELSVAGVTVTEGTKAEFVVSLNAASGQQVTVSYATADGTAKAGEDYSAETNGTLTFVVGATKRTIGITTAEDSRNEAQEEFTVTLSNRENATLATDGTTATGTITDDDDPPNLSIGNATAVVEGQAAEFEVSLDQPSGKEVTVTYATGDTDDTAQAPGDYQAVANTTLTFAAGDQVKTITVATEDDDLDEEDGETFTVTLSAPGNAELAADGTTATGTINDADDEPQLSIGNATAVVEGQAAEFVVSLNAASGQQVTVSYATADGTAKAGEDYSAETNGTLTFVVGATKRTIGITTAEDSRNEAQEEFTVTLSNRENATLATDGTTATGTITDDDTEPELSVAGVTVTEGTKAEFVVSLNAASGQQVTVSYATADGTAKAGEDYSAETNGTLTFVVGATKRTIGITTAEDSRNEAQEEFTVTLSNRENATLATDGTTATGTITDDDTEPELSVAGVTVTEGAKAEFVVSLNAASGQQVTVSYATADGTAKAGEDYSAETNGTLTFVVGATKRTIGITTAEDSRNEAQEEFTVTLSNRENATLATDGTTATGTITDDDTEPELSVAGVTVTEGTKAEFVVSLNAASGQQVTVSYATADGTAKAGEDYSAETNGTLTFVAGDEVETFTVTTLPDEVDEPDTETFTVKLSAPVNATLSGGGSELEATGTIRDDDTPSVLTLADVKVKEATHAVFEVRLGAKSERQVTVEYGTGKTDDTAKEPGDYTTASGTLTFAAGQQTKNITVTTIDDTVDEADSEQYTMTLSNAVHATLFGEGTTLEATGTIEDNDEPPVLSLEDVTVTEGKDAEFEVSLDAASERQVLVTYGTADVTAVQPDDYTAASGTLTFAANDRAKTITVTTENDELDEARTEQFKLTLSGANNATLSGGEYTLQKLGKIEDNDDPPMLSVGDETVTEGAAAEFEVSLDAASARQVTVSYATSNDTAEEPDDYTDTSGSLTFAAGDRTKIVTVTTSTDSLNEADETFKITLSSPENGTLDEADGTIEDDDELTAAVTREAETVDEDASATFTVTLTGGKSTDEVVVDYSEVGSATAGDDYTAPSGKLTIEAEQDSGQITIKTLEDYVLDQNETLKVQLKSATSAGSVEVNTTTAETRIIDSSEVKVSVKAAVLVEDDPNTPEDESQDSSVVEEGGTASFSVELSGAVGVEVLVPYTTVDGSALAGADKDYTANSGTLTFAPSDISKTVEIVTRNDDLSEVAETFEVRLTATSLPEGVTVTTASATGTITDNDTLTAAVTADVSTVTEGQSATFTVTLKGGTSTAEVVVDYSPVGTATEDDDYTAPSGKLTIGASDASAEIAIKTLQDNVLDWGETLEVRLDSATTDGAATVSPDTAETTITDTGTVEVSVTGLSVEEGDPPATVDKSSVEEGEAANFVVALSGPVQKPVEVSYATSDGSGSDAATAGTDYTAADVTLTFSSKETSKTVAVATTEDLFNEADETFTLTLTGVTLPDGVSLDATTAAGTIENDDGLTATVKANAENVPEGNNAEFTVELTGGTSTADVELTYTWASTGTAGTDYTEPSGLLTITTPNSSGTIAIATEADGVLDPGETLSVTLTGADTAIGAAKVGTPATATTKIVEEGTETMSVRKDEVLDDENTPEDESAVVEGESATFVVELSGAVANAVQVAYATSNGTGAGDAVADTDYTDTSGTLTFTSGESLTQTIAVKTTDDKLNEATEEFTVTLTGPDLPDLVSIGTSSAQGIITDNDGLTAAVTAAKPSVNEGETAEFVVALTGGTSNADVLSTAAVLVFYTVGGTATSGDDYTAPAALTLTIGTGVASGTISIETLTDREVEGNDETLEVTLTGASTSTGTATVDADNDTATTAINNTTAVTINPRPPPGASRTAIASRSNTLSPEEWEMQRSSRLYSAGDCYTCADEGKSVEIYLGLDHPDGGPVTLAQGLTIEAEYQTADRTAHAATDYTMASGTLTFRRDAMGEALASVTLDTTHDTLNEADEEFDLTFMKVTLPDGKETTPGDVAVTIEDNDPITARVTASDQSVTEGESVSFTVTLTGGESTDDVRIHYAVAGTATSGSDYRAPSGTLTIAQDSTRGTFTIRTVDDTESESEETLEVSLTNQSNSAGRVTPSGEAAVTIVDNDSLTVWVESATATEGNPVEFVVRMSNVADEALEVSYATADGTGADDAVDGTDYTKDSGTLTFSPGETSKTVAVPTFDDELNEADETFTLTLTANLPDWAKFGTTSATGTIDDDDELTVAVTADAKIVAEGDPATFTVELSGGTSTGDVVVAYDVGGMATAGDDYTAPDGTLTIDMDEVSGTITIATRTDGQVEADESLTVTLDSATTVGAVTVDTTPATTIVIDPPAVTIDDPRGVVENAGEILFEVNLKRSSTRQITVDYRTEDGTATAPEDYVAQSGRLTFAAGETRRTISIRMLDDALDEADEIFTVILSAPENARLDGDTVSATGTIIDNDNPPALTIADASAKESAGEIAFRVSLDAPSGREVAVSYRTEDGTAKAGEDYGETDGTLTIAAGRTAATILVALKNDILEEAEETFTVRLLDPVNAELADSAATGTILDDDISVAQVWLARFGRTVATHVVDAVGERLNEAAGRSSEAAIAGHPLQPAPIPAESQESTPIPFRALAGHELVAGSSFRLASSADEDEAADGGSKWTGWGRGAVTRLAGKEPKADLSLRGTIATGAAGVDYDWGGVLTGLAMAYTGGGGNFQTDAADLEQRSGTAESWLLSAHPYARVSVVDGLEVWGLLGYGLGMMTLTEDASVNTNITLMMGAAGVRGMLLTPAANGGFGVVVSSDGFAMRANGDAAGRQPAVEADAVRGRLLLEGSYDAHLGDGSVLIPMVEAGMRYDAGHAEEGFGAELGGGFRYIKPEWGLTATANGRFVLAHQDRGFQEWGLRGSLQWSPGAGGLGPSLGVNTSVGTASSGVQRLWAQGATPIPAAPDSAGPAGRVDAQLGYGMSVDLLGTNARLTPYAGLTLADGGTQAYRVGGRAILGPAFSLSLEGERRESSGAAPAHGITLSGSLHW